MQMDRKEWINYCRSRELEGDIIVKWELGRTTGKKVWVSRFLEVKNIPVFVLSKDDIDLIANMSGNELYQRSNQFMTRDISMNSLYIPINDETFWKRQTTDKKLVFVLEFKYGYDVDLKSHHNVDIMCHNIVVRKEVIYNLVYDYLHEFMYMGFLDDNYNPYVNSKLEYLNLLNLFTLLSKALKPNI